MARTGSVAEGVIKTTEKTRKNKKDEKKKRKKERKMPPQRFHEKVSGNGKI